MAKKSQKPDGKLVYKNEKSFRRALVDIIENNDGLAQPIESTTGSGIPDLYYSLHHTEPTWAELKVVRKGDVVKLSKRQYKWLTENSAAGGRSELIINDHQFGLVLLVVVTNQTYGELNSLSWLRVAGGTDIDIVSSREGLDSLLS